MEKQRLKYPWLSQLVEAGKEDDSLYAPHVLEFLDGERTPSSFVNVDLNWSNAMQGYNYWSRIYMDCRR